MLISRIWKIEICLEVIPTHPNPFLAVVGKTHNSVTGNDETRTSTP